MLASVREPSPMASAPGAFPVAISARLRLVTSSAAKALRAPRASSTASASGLKLLFRRAESVAASIFWDISSGMGISLSYVRLASPRGRCQPAVASTTIVRILTVRLEALEIAGHYRLHRVRMFDAEPGQGAPFGLGSPAHHVVALQHAHLVDGERAHPVRQRQGEQRAELGGPEGHGQIEALACGPVLNPV